MGKKIMVLHGPNVNLTGVRQTDIYGREGIAAINEQIRRQAADCGFECEILQSNHEGALIDALQRAREECAGVVINPAAFASYSYAIRDAVALLNIPCIEVHLSNIYARDPFRAQSVLSPVCAGTIAGLGKQGYLLAVAALKGMVR